MKIYKIVILCLCFHAFLMHTHAQNEPDLQAKVREARLYLLGYMKEYNPAKAHALYLECAQSGSAVAMNALGNLYMNGLGVDRNDSVGVRWFRRAADAGYIPAWSNLAQAYHYARGVAQDFEQAYACYQRVDAPEGWYHLGYLHYKGLGCLQDYKQAAMNFQKAAQKGYGSAQYFLGLCYRNGYGVERDMNKGDSLVALGRDRLVIQARQELEADSPENSFPQSLLKTVVDDHPSAGSEKALTQESPGRYRRVEHNIKGRSLEGEYTGYLIRYDWSGQVAIDQSELRVTLIQRGNHIEGEWREGEKKVAVISGELTDTALIFTDGEYRRTTHYQPVEGITHQLQNAVLDLVYSDSTVFLAGNVRMFLPGVMEPAKPMYLTLKSVEIEALPQELQKELPIPDVFQIEAVKGLRAYPNPFEGHISVAFYLPQGGDVLIQVFDMAGRPVYSGRLAGLTQGSHLTELSLSGPAGPYIIRLTSQGRVYTTLVIKK